MKLFKQIIAVVMCVAVLASVASMGASVSADEAKTVVEAVRWFPCDADRQNDFIWEVEATKEGCLCQSFDADPAETGMNAYLSTTYGEDGSLTLQRTDALADEFYWPRIRTISLETYPELDIKTANTLFFDIEATNMSWNVYMTFNGMNIKLGRAMAEATGATVAGSAGSDDDAPAGHYVGSVNIIDALTAMANNGDPHATEAMSIVNMKKTFVPQIQVFVVGGFEGTVKINKLFLSTADDTEGAKTEHVDMGMIMGDEWYEDGGAEGGDTDGDTDTDTTTTADGEDDTTTTKKKTTTTKASEEEEKNDGNNTGLIVGIVVAAVVVVAIVVVVVVAKKKKA